LQRQIDSFLQAARHLGSGDFATEVPTFGHDEFAALGEDFNKMSRQLAERLEELNHERARLEEPTWRIGQTFAPNLDREGLRARLLSRPGSPLVPRSAPTPAALSTARHRCSRRHVELDQPMAQAAMHPLGADDRVLGVIYVVVSGIARLVRAVVSIISLIFRGAFALVAAFQLRNEGGADVAPPFTAAPA
jgi:hypothetical protein